jgi:rhodanese-related sulfurtransferase
MKRFLHYLPLVLVVGIVFFSSCGDDEPERPDYPAHEIIVEHLKAKNLDLPTMFVDWIVDPPALANVNDFINSYYIMDIRGTAYYNAGHIEGAISSALLYVVDDAENADKPILLVDQTGQISGHALVALRMSGYPNCQVLKWGMAGWNSDFSGPWINNVRDTARSYSSWEAPPGNLTAAGGPYDKPTIRTIETDPDSLLEDRVNSLVDGYRNERASTVLNGPSGYFIDVYMDDADIAEYGHIKGALKLPLSIAGDEIYKLNIEKGIAIYSWTGHTSSVVTAWLVILGYGVESISFGANAMIYSDLPPEHKYTIPTVNLPYLTE